MPHFINGREPQFTIGTKFKTRGRYPQLCTVADVLRTYNDADEWVKTRYMATHEFMGQTVFDVDVSETTIAMGEIKKRCQ